ncbi:thiamine/thiamine pyrophosphate ABC transporter permease ThiP [Mergibacter septicus]|uniref:thiamine/thiamine pyrophosphate ABC transporter permease ThiP n=1 Tax=Mergibacter septicus TaxID=221402 RepID=UPI001179842D|nr:thiamine/thiamine pyrophosphate ABC transporter permease ThiP [Mergibacter septicus]AWX13322.1 thiamine/thiamine pyrophosphate ABC transporter permease ThiP [Mergibacter septicus]
MLKNFYKSVLYRYSQIKSYFWGIAVFIFLLFFYASSLIALWQQNGTQWGELWQDPYLWHVIRFSFYQASLSVVLSLVLAIPVARALFYLEFFAKPLLLKLFTLTYVLPSLVVIFGIIGVYGNNGWLSHFFHCFNLTLPSVYGLNGILLTHLFFNMPLASKVLLQSLQSIPPQQHQLAAQLNIRGWAFFRLIELPYIRQQLLPLASLIFLLCFTSFTIVLTLGGGPKYTTLEVAIYQAITFDFDLSKAAFFAVLQFIFCFGLFTVTTFFHQAPPSSPHNSWWIAPISQLNKVVLSLILISAMLFIILPLLNTLYSALKVSDFWAVWFNPELWQAIGFTIILAPTAGMISVFFSLGLLLTARQLRWQKYRWLAENFLNIGTLILAIPTLVLAIGLYLNLQHFDVDIILLFLIVAIYNALMAMPFVIRLLAVPLNNNMLHYQNLCLSLNIRGWKRWLLVEKATLLAPLKSAFAFATALSLGDFTIIALLGSQDFTSLPRLLYQQLGHYKTQDAAVTALILLLMCCFIFLFIERQTMEQKNATDDFS